MKRFMKIIYHAWINFLVLRKHRRSNKIGNSVFIHKNAIIGADCVIGNHVTIAGDVVLGNNVQIGSGATLERITLGDNSAVEGKAIITGHGKGRIVVGSESFIGHNTVLDYSDNITIGNFVHIGYSQFWTHSSAKMCVNGIPLSDKSDKHRPANPIVIEDCVYVGVHSTIYPGVTIGHHSIVAPNSVVSKNVPPYSLVGGVPAQLIKSTEQMIDK